MLRDVSLLLTTQCIYHYDLNIKCICWSQWLELFIEALLRMPRMSPYTTNSVSHHSLLHSGLMNGYTLPRNSDNINNIFMQNDKSSQTIFLLVCIRPIFSDNYLLISTFWPPLVVFISKYVWSVPQSFSCKTFLSLFCTTSCLTLFWQKCIVTKCPIFNFFKLGLHS